MAAGIGVFVLVEPASGAPHVSVPAANAATSRLCSKLHAALPATVGGGTKRSTSPKSDLTAAWGSPAITMRCGVPKPTALIPGSPNFNPTLDELNTAGVMWLVEQNDAGDYRFTTVDRSVFIELDIPGAYSFHETPAGDLTDAILGTIPNAAGRMVPDPQPTQ